MPSINLGSKYIPREIFVTFGKKPGQGWSVININTIKEAAASYAAFYESMYTGSEIKTRKFHNEDWLE